MDAAGIHGKTLIRGQNLEGLENVICRLTL